MMLSRPFRPSRIASLAGLGIGALALMGMRTLLIPEHAASSARLIWTLSFTLLVLGIACAVRDLAWLEREWAGLQRYRAGVASARAASFERLLGERKRQVSQLLSDG